MEPLGNVKTTFELKGHRSLLLALLLMILVSPALQQHATLGWLLAVMLMLVLLAAVITVARHKREFQIALVLGVLALVPQFGLLISEFEWLAIVRYLATMLFMFWVCSLLLRDIILRSRNVNIDLILGAINIYLMIALGFAFAFGLIEHLQPGLNAPERVAQRHAVATLQRLGDNGRVARRVGTCIDSQLGRLDQFRPILLEHTLNLGVQLSRAHLFVGARSAWGSNGPNSSR